MVKIIPGQKILPRKINTAKMPATGYHWPDWHAFTTVSDMKKQILFIALLLSSLSLQVHAQVRLSVNLNAQPVWGPVGYDRADYYYMPDIEAYYSVSNRQYTYNDGGRWVTSGNLPPRYSNYDVYNGYKVVVNEPSPWTHDSRYRKQYSQYRGRHDQAMIRDSHDERYYANPGHPQHNNWVQQHGNDRQQGGNDHRDQGHGNEGHDNGDHGGEHRDH
jgi:hypothetical protein